MELYIIRHAIAEERRVGLVDAERQLTDEGTRRFGLAVRGLAELGVRFDMVFHSPWTRARQTAEQLAPLLDGEMRSTANLADEPSEALLHELQGERVAAVGHEPWMSELMLWLLVGSAEAPVAVAFKKGGVAWLRGEPAPGAMELRGFFTPRALRAIA